jgi:hypothetical protein|tara:strand:- start:995 stop:1387 length:393 start_codon:yes stop_codon:yes gene_type:complete
MGYYITLKLLGYKPLTEDLKKIFNIIEWLLTSKKSNLSILRKIDFRLKRINFDFPSKIVEQNVSIDIASILCSYISITFRGKQVYSLTKNFLGNLDKSVYYYRGIVKTPTNQVFYIRSLEDLSFPIPLSI